MNKTDVPAVLVAGVSASGRGDETPSTTSPDRSKSKRTGDLFWLGAALALNLVFTARTMAPAFGPDVVQDDARLHIFWMARFRDPELFRNDLIADYYQALAPPGYSALYWTLSWVIDPLVASKLLPPVLGALVVLFTFLFVRQLHPQPTAAFLSCGLLSWYSWQLDDLSSGTPRAFFMPLLAAQAWALVTSRRALSVGLVVLSAAFYPAAGALGLALVATRVFRFIGWRPAVSRERSDWLTLAVAVMLVAAVLLPTQIATSRFGPTVSIERARAMPEFGPDGRDPFFVRDGFSYWVKNRNSGLDLRAAHPRFGATALLVGSVVLAVLLPSILLVQRRFPTAIRVRDAAILLQLMLSSFALFFLAHLVLFHLYYPDRYVRTSLPLIVAVAAGLVLATLIEVVGRAVWAWLTAPERIRPTPPRPAHILPPLAGRASKRRGAVSGNEVVTGGLALALGIGLAAYPSIASSRFFRDEHPAITRHLRSLPKDVMVAAVPRDNDGVPTFARRRVLASQQFAVAVHEGYYGEIRRRIDDLIQAYYSDSLWEIAEFTARHQVDILLVNRRAFRESTFADVWIGDASGKWQPFTSTVSRKLQGNRNFALLEVARRCSAVDDGDLAVVTSECLLGVALASTLPVHEIGDGVPLGSHTEPITAAAP
jgi:hypothetical protein